MPSNSKGRGVLPVSAAQTRKPPKQQQPRPPAPRLKVLVRRLPPGLTEPEFWTLIGVDWHVGRGKVDWASFKPGKVSKDLAKPSRPGRAYLKVKEHSHLDQLSTHVKDTVFQDARNSFRDSCLVGPPSLEFAPYNKIPNSRVRHDGRQGSIDQDQDFMEFLQSLTEPITKANAGADAADNKQKMTTTPLIQYIKEKKANKAKEKEAAAAKGAKKGQDGKETKESKDGKDGKDAKAATTSKVEQATVIKKGAPSEAEKSRVAKATQQAMDSIKKSVAEIKGQNAPKLEPKTAEKKDPNPPQTTPKRERQRGDVSAAARIIGRDLGLAPKEGRTPRGQRAVTQSAAAVSSISTTPSPSTIVSTPPSSAASAQNTPVRPPTGPRNLRTTTPQPSPLRPNNTPQTPKAKPFPQTSASAKSAFLKHANPSQGITEELLREAFLVYGEITRCEIDKKKGLGYIDFTENEALRKAMSASPIKIGNGSVVVLENRTPYKKLSHGGKSITSSPSASTPSSPKILSASLASIAEQATPVSAGQSAAFTAPTSAASQGPVDPDPAAIGTTTIPEVGTAPTTTTAQLSENALLTSPSTATTPNAPRGGRGGQRDNFRGRGFRGRGGQFRGGNRAASSPNPAGGASQASTPTSDNKG